MLIKTLNQMPDLLSLHHADPAFFPCLLMSSKEAGWDILLAAPRQSCVYQAADQAHFIQDLQALEPETGDFAVEAKALELPFYGGWFVYLAYDILDAFEPSVLAAHEHDFPIGMLADVPAAILINRASKAVYLVSETADLQTQIEDRIANCEPFVPQKIQLETLKEDPPTWYTDAVQRLHRYIREGDVFQVNISRAWEAQVSEGICPADVFAALRQYNPAPFSSLIYLDGAYIISSSPERLVEVREGWASTRPIAGTHPRSLDPDEDVALKQRLMDSTKERAEHVMLVDLERNDLGRICEPGTVRVDELMAVESYAFVHHIESNIRGKLRQDIRPFDVIRALFPGGTITGCPKVRTMQIIRELEVKARRAYTGTLGYINRDGSMDLNILIRTFMWQNQHLEFRAGGGIVIDSDPERELMETRHKARGLLRALGVAEA